MRGKWQHTEWCSKQIEDTVSTVSANPVNMFQVKLSRHLKKLKILQDVLYFLEILVKILILLAYCDF